MSALSEADELVSKLRMIKHQEDLNLPWSVTSDILSQLATCLRNSECLHSRIHLSIGVHARPSDEEALSNIQVRLEVF